MVMQKHVAGKPHPAPALASLDPSKIYRDRSTHSGLKPPFSKFGPYIPMLYNYAASPGHHPPSNRNVIESTRKHRVKEDQRAAEPQCLSALPNRSRVLPYRNRTLPPRFKNPIFPESRFQTLPRASDSLPLRFCFGSAKHDHPSASVLPSLAVAKGSVFENSYQTPAMAASNFCFVCFMGSPARNVITQSKLLESGSRVGKSARVSLGNSGRAVLTDRGRSPYFYGNTMLVLNTYDGMSHIDEVPLFRFGTWVLVKGFVGLGQRKGDLELQWRDAEVQTENADGGDDHGVQGQHVRVHGEVAVGDVVLEEGGGDRVREWEDGARDDVYGVSEIAKVK
ncbi:hypothetical protein ACLB2K_004703 [Fragaria x ananassa]